MASLEQILASLQLDRYVDTFKKNELDLDSAKMLSEKEFEELGLALGPRKKLYAYFHSAPSVTGAPAAAGASAVAPAAAAAGGASTSKCGKITNIMAWDWCHDSAKWTDQGGASDPTHFRLSAGDEPTQLLWAGRTRRGNAPFRVFNIERGAQEYDYTPSKGDPEDWRDADWSGDTIVCVGGNYDGTLAVFDAATRQEKGVLIGRSEMSMSDVAIVTSASGAMQACALGQGNGQCYPPMRLFDIATLSRAGKFADVYDSPPSGIQPDHNNPGCFLASSHHKFWYIDSRVGKAVKRFGEGASSIHLPANPGSQFIAADRCTNNPVQVWDLGTQKVLHTLQTAQQRNFASACMFSNVAVTFGPMYTGTGGNWGMNFFDLISGAKCVHELNASTYANHQMAMAARVVVGMSNSSEFISLMRPA